MKNFGIWSVATAGLYVLQSSLLPWLSYHGLSTNLMLLWVVSFAFLKGHPMGVFMGFCAGLLQDLATGTFLGCNILSCMLLGYVCGRLSVHVFKEDFLLPILSSTIASVIHYFIMFSLMLLLGYRLNLSDSVHYTLVPMMFYQLALAYPVHRLAYGLYRYTKKE